MPIGTLRTVGAGLAAAGLLAALAVSGRELHAVALVCALAAIALQPQWSSRRDVPAVLVALALLLSTHFAPVPASGLPMLTCVAVVAGMARLPPAIGRALFAGCLTIAVLVLALVTAFELAKLGELRSIGYPGLKGWGGFPEIGLLGVMTLPVALSLALGPGPWEARAGAAVATITAAAGLVLSGSRAAWGAAAIGVMLVAVGRRPSRRTVTAAAVSSVALLVIVVAIGSRRPPATGGAVPLDIASSSRLEAWSQAAQFWRERPWTGWGPASYPAVYVRHHDRPGDSPEGLPADARYHAHSAYLNLAVETGVLGLATALWFAAAVLAGAGSRAAPRRTMVAAARMGLVCGLIAVAVRFVADYFDPAGPGMRVMLWLAIVAGLRLALESPRAETTA